MTAKTVTTKIPLDLTRLSRRIIARQQALAQLKAAGAALSATQKVIADDPDYLTVFCPGWTKSLYGACDRVDTMTRLVSAQLAKHEDMFYALTRPVPPAETPDALD